MSAAAILWSLAGLAGIGVVAAFVRAWRQTCADCAASVELSGDVKQ